MGNFSMKHRRRFSSQVSTQYLALGIYVCMVHLPTTLLKLTAKPPENAWLECYFSYRDGLIFRGRVSCREGNLPWKSTIHGGKYIFSMDPMGILVFGAEYLKHFVLLIAPRFIGRRGCTNSTSRNFAFQSLLVLFKIKKVIGSIQARNQSNISRH